MTIAPSASRSSSSAASSASSHETSERPFGPRRSGSSIRSLAREVRIREAALVAEPAAVDLGVVAGEDPLDLPLADRRRRVAADRAAGADGGHVLDLPRPRVEAVEARRERSDRTELDHVPREDRAVRLVLEGRDLGARAPVPRDQLAVLGDLLGEARAAVAEDAALAVERDERGHRDRLVERDLREGHARRARPVAEGEVLERALAALVADRAVERMVHEDELERRLLALGRLRGGRGRADDHALARGERAAGLDLRDPLDLDEAHAAGADGRPEPRLVAEDRNLDPRRERRLDEAGPRRDLHRAVVDRQRDEVRHGRPRRGRRGWSTGAKMPSIELSPSNGQRMCSTWAANSSRYFRR